MDAGSYHIEVIGKGTAIEVLVSDATDKAVSASGFKALAIMVIDGKSQRIALEPSADGKKPPARRRLLSAPSKALFN